MRRKSLTASIVAFVLLLSSYQSHAQKRAVEAGYRGSRYSFRDYHPKTIGKLGELPPTVLAELVSHLKSRLGERFYGALEFSWGEMIDLDELYRVEPYWKREEVGSYDLTFYFSDQKKGLKAFYSKIVLDARGHAIEEINLPDLANYPEKANLISVAQAMKIAADNGFVGSSKWPDFEYNEENESFAWVIHDGQEVKQKGVCPSSDDVFMIGHGPYRRIFIEAHTGRVLKTDCYSIVF